MQGLTAEVASVGGKVQVTVAPPALQQPFGDQLQHGHVIRPEPLGDGDEVRYRAAVSFRRAV